ncbi:MAG: restriction endonuclease subunit S [Paludibacteraceae bacterium]|nr:restriction endonuclease subunit S [Paludibacteraceae bacterium]
MDKYSSYKDSGVKWLGEIPSHWEMVRLRYLCRIKTGDKDTINRDENGKYPFYVRSPKVERINSYTYDGEAVLMAGDGVGAGKVFHYVNGKFGCHQRVYIINNIEKVNGKFLYYYMQSKFKYVIEQLSAKSTVDSVRLNMLQDFNVLIPSLKEQLSIIKYIEFSVYQIDTAIEQQKKMIDLLNERKQIIINNAVTKGLDPNVKMKDSGVDWIGEIPEGWEVRRLKTILHTKDKRNSDPNALLLSVYTAIGVRPRQELEERGNKASTVINYKIVNKGDLIVNRLLAWMGAYGLSDYNGVTSPDYDVYSFQGKVNIHYYETLFRNTQFKSDCYKYGHGIMMMRWRTYSDEFLSINVPIPPKEEQDAIYDYLRPQIKKITEGVYQCEQQIALLQERKQIIINEVVTGKVKVS